MASDAAPSITIPNFAFPSTDKELEALLPDTMCGGKTQKFSMGGDVFESSADAFLAQAVTEGTTYTMESIGGRDVYVDSSADPPSYTYVKGDGIVFAYAGNAKDAASILSALP